MTPLHPHIHQDYVQFRTELPLGSPCLNSLSIANERRIFQARLCGIWCDKMGWATRTMVGVRLDRTASSEVRYIWFFPCPTTTPRLAWLFDGRVSAWRWVQPRSPNLWGKPVQFRHLTTRRHAVFIFLSSPASQWIYRQKMSKGTNHAVLWYPNLEARLNWHPASWILVGPKWLASLGQPVRLRHGLHHVPADPPRYPQNANMILCTLQRFSFWGLSAANIRKTS
jgi:hypothetical protein